MKHIQVVAAIFSKISVDHGYEIFCVQRPGPKPGSQPKETDFKWEFPGGKVEEGETHEDALKREIWEELEATAVTLHLYYCTPNGPFQLREHIDSCWRSVESLGELDWAPADYPVIARLQELEEKDRTDRFFALVC